METCFRKLEHNTTGDVYSSVRAEQNGDMFS